MMIMREMLPEDDIENVIGNLNGKVFSDRILPVHVMGKHDLGDRNNNEKKFVGFFRVVTRK